MGRGNNTHNDALGGRRQGDADLNEIAERARQLLPKYGGFVTGAVNQAFILSGRPGSVEEMKRVEQLVEQQPEPQTRPLLCRIFIDGDELDTVQTDRPLAELLRAVVADHPEADWIVVVNAHESGDRVAYDRKRDEYLL